MKIQQVLWIPLLKPKMNILFQKKHQSRHVYRKFPNIYLSNIYLYVLFFSDLKYQSLGCDLYMAIYLRILKQLMWVTLLLIVNVMHDENLWEVDEEMMIMFDSDDDDDFWVSWTHWRRLKLSFLLQMYWKDKNWFVTLLLRRKMSNLGVPTYTWQLWFFHCFEVKSWGCDLYIAATYNQKLTVTFFELFVVMKG